MISMRWLATMALGILIGAGATWFTLHRMAGSSGPVKQHPPTSATTPPAGEKKVLYWYDPMVPEKQFDRPGKSPFMDMPLVPRYAEGADTPGLVSIDPRAVQNLGVRTARAERGSTSSPVRSIATVAFDETAMTVVQARVAGFVESLAVRAALTPVTQGQVLLTLVAPDWTAAQEDYLALQRSRAAGLDGLRAAAKQRLLLLGMSDGQIRAMEQAGRAQTRIAVTAPRSGVVGDLAVREGASVMPGTPLLRINGLDTLWVNASIPETQIARVKTGASASIELPAFPGERFAGTVDALLPEVDATTRTQVARIVLRNADRRVAAGMFARVEIAGSERESGIVVSTDSVIATGTRNVVIVAESNGHFRAQEVRIGEEAGGKTQILAGIDDGENVVLSGQFLIDSEASLNGTLVRLQSAGELGANTPEKRP